MFLVGLTVSEISNFFNMFSIKINQCRIARSISVSLNLNSKVTGIIGIRKKNSRIWQKWALASFFSVRYPLVR